MPKIGTSDSEGRDYEHTLEMATLLKNELKTVDVYLLLFHGQKPRITSPTTTLLKLYGGIFSDSFWNHVISEITWWKSDIDSIEDR